MSVVSTSDVPAVAVAGTASAGVANSDGASRLAVLEGQVEILKAALRPEKKSTFTLVKEYAGFVGVAISILTGSFTVWQTVVVQPEQKSAEVRTEFRGLINQLAAIEPEATQKIARATDSNEVAAVIGNANMNRISLLQRAEALLPRVKDDLSLIDYWVLSQAHWSSADFEKARTYATSAWKTASTNLEKAESLKYLAKANFGFSTPASIAEGEKNLETALTLLDHQSTDMNISFKRVDILGVHVILEGMVGDCAASSKAFETFKGEVMGTQINADARKLFVGLINKQYSQMAKCPALPQL